MGQAKREQERQFEEDRERIEEEGVTCKVCGEFYDSEALYWTEGMCDRCEHGMSKD